TRTWLVPPRRICDLHVRDQTEIVVQGRQGIFATHRGVILVELQTDVRVPSCFDDADRLIDRVDPVAWDVGLVDVLDQYFDSALGGELGGLSEVSQHCLLGELDRRVGGRYPSQDIDLLCAQPLRQDER